MGKEVAADAKSLESMRLMNSRKRKRVCVCVCLCVQKKERTSDRLEAWLIPSGTTRFRQQYRSTMV